MAYTFSFPTLIHFGPGARHGIALSLKEKKLMRPLVVTDKGVASQGFLHAVQRELSEAGFSVAVFSGVFGNPVKSQVLSGLSAFREHGADAIIGIGGGAALDVAKAICLMVHHPGDLFDYAEEKPGVLNIDQPLPFWLAVPTTAGTGSEVGRSTVISDDKTHVKKIIFSPRLLAPEVFADPELTVGLPSTITAATGMDAVTHLVESYLAKGFHPICDGIALEGLRLASESLPKCIMSPQDIEARSSMLLASMMGAIAFQKGLGLTHSCAHALSTHSDLHHGLANGIMIAYAIPLNFLVAQDRFSQLCSQVALKEKSGPAFVDWLNRLRAQIGIPNKLSEVGIRKEDIHRLSELAFEDSCHLNNPRLCTQDDFFQIFSLAL